MAVANSPSSLRPDARRSSEALVWIALALSLIILAALPWFLDAERYGDALVRGSVRLALLYYGIAACFMLTLRPSDWWPLSSRARLALAFWCAAYAAYLIHLAMAFHYYHHWSHADAVDHTREVSGVGEGIYVSHLFTLLWGADVAYWLVLPAGYASRNAWIGWALHAFMIFIIFNGTVVYETGFIRWAGVALLTVLAIVWIVGRASRRQPDVDVK
jgi:hypothetical protein